MPLAPNTDNLLLGRGKVYFNRFDSNGDPTGWLHLGNTPGFSLNIETETLEHYSSVSGIRVKDKEIVLEQNIGFSITLEEFSKENLALAFFGSEEAASQNSGTVTDEAITAVHDRYVELQYRKISNVVVTNDVGDVTYNEGTDYLVDYEEGMILAKSSGNITDGQALKVDYDYGAFTAYKINAMQVSQVKGSLKFVGKPASGPPIILTVWKCQIRPSGEIGLISDEWASFTLECTAENDESNHPNAPYYEVLKLEDAWS